MFTHIYRKYLIIHYSGQYHNDRSVPSPQGVQFTSSQSDSTSHTQRMRTARDTPVSSIVAIDCVYLYRYTVSILIIHYSCNCHNHRSVVPPQRVKFISSRKLERILQYIVLLPWTVYIYAYIP